MGIYQNRGLHARSLQGRTAPAGTNLDTLAAELQGRMSNLDQLIARYTEMIDKGDFRMSGLFADGAGAAIALAVIALMAVTAARISAASSTTKTFFFSSIIYATFLFFNLSLIVLARSSRE